MEPPQLRCAEAPMRTSLGAPVPMFVDESVGNIWVQECQELGGASRRKRRVHGPANYSLKLYLSAKSGEQHISRTTCLLHITYTETRNTLFKRNTRMLVGTKRPQSRVGNSLTETQNSHPFFQPQTMFLTEILCKLLLLGSSRPDNTEVPLKRII